MPHAQYEEIHKSKIETQLLERYLSEIRAVEQLGFADLQFVREVTFPFSLLLLPWAYFGMRAAREVFRIEFPLRYVLMNPVLMNGQYDTYCNIFGMGTKFATRFDDGTIIISGNYPSLNVENTRHKIYKYSPPQQEGVGIAWERHLERIAETELRGVKTDRRLSLDAFEEIMVAEDKVMLGF